MTGSTNIVRLHHVLRAPVGRVYKAFLDRDALCRWLPPYGFLGNIDRIDAQVGGSFHMAFTNFESGHQHAFESTFLELVPGERIRTGDKFDDPAWAADMTKTITFKAVSWAPNWRFCTKDFPSLFHPTCAITVCQRVLLRTRSPRDRV